MKKQKYTLTRKLHAGVPMVAGNVVELTAEQAASPMYRNRIKHAPADLEVATPGDDAPVTLKPLAPLKK